MLKFQKVDREHMEELAPYFAAQTMHISDYSLGFQFMWSEALSPDYCFARGCLVLHEFFSGKHYFYYPLSLTGDEEAERAALDEIERYCRDTNRRLHFTNVPKEKLLPLLLRYGTDCAVNDRRRWRDYLYRASDFRDYPGKKFSGQRNHVNKFKKTYPIWQFRRVEPEDEPAVLAFLKEYSVGQLGKGEFLADEEMEEALAILPEMKALGIFAGILLADGKIVGFSAGERCGDMVVVHLEKALRTYEGVYPMLAQCFAQMFCGEGVNYLNRMDDAGDMGLRKSKLQYRPVEIVSKYTVLPRRAIDALPHPPEIGTERLVLRAVDDGDAGTFYRLAYDGERNRYWGYDWRADYDGEPPEDYFLKLAREDFHHRDEVSLGIYAEDGLVGEAVLHRFGYRSECELGVRLLPEAEGKGYAREAMKALAEYAFLKLGLERAEAKCFRENLRSERMLRAAGFLPCGSDETYFYFYKTPDM